MRVKHRRRALGVISLNRYNKVSDSHRRDRVLPLLKGNGRSAETGEKTKGLAAKSLKWV